MTTFTPLEKLDVERGVVLQSTPTVRAKDKSRPVIYVVCRTMPGLRLWPSSASITARRAMRAAQKEKCADV